ncbi:MAG: Maltodextrin ABC transporter, ATP-binding protein MsmX [Ktedonobacterales bacterium]|jgi:multiple sugar transport system ATP-binding protein|nr:MAG: Maltodextrin ABC transporter, ATP-binding protein MsmX [Ktedonobacterales bacterium]
MAEVRFDHVTKRYGGNAPVINDLNLLISDHEFLVLVGPSGCGKSTALRMIAGLEDITEGDLYIGDRRINDVAPKDRDIAMVFQNYALYPHMSVYENLAFSLKLRHVEKSEIQQRVERAAEMLGIADYLARKPKALSGGQRQRVALGRALVRDPQVFLLDEPLSNLDAKLRVQTRTEIARLHQTTGTTFVYVTHDQVEAMTMGDRIAVLNAGVIQQLGTPQELYDTPANLFVAGFIGSPAMNFFNARLIRSAAGIHVDVGADSQTREIAIGDALAERVASEATTEGRPVVVGIRPEDFRPATDHAQNTVPGTVEVAEHLGNEQLVHMQIPGALMLGAAETQGSTVRLPPHVRVQPGDHIMLTVESAKLHLFDPTTTNRLA